MCRHILSSITIFALFSALFLPAFVFGQGYPEKPVRVVIVFPPGGANDIVGRTVFQKMTEQMGQSFIIDNRGGAGGTIGASIVAKSPHDGYTIMVYSATLVSNAHLYKKLPYDALADFTGISPLGRQVGVLVVHPSMPIKSVAELTKLARHNPGRIAYGSSGNGSNVHLATALFTHMTKVNMVHVPYKGGGPAVIALVSGEVQLMTANIGSVLPQIKAGRVRPVGVTSKERVNQLPDVPAIAETVSGYELTSWVGCFVPSGTPMAIVHRLNDEVKKVLSSKDVVATLSGKTLDPMYMSVDAFAQYLQDEYKKYGDLIKLTGTKIE